MNAVGVKIALRILTGYLVFVAALSGAADELADGFREPPASARPHVWWHWMNGNVSKAGITADLEAMAKAGIGGAQVFDVSDGIPPGPVAFDTPLWHEMLHHANEEAKRLGLELCLANCSGWSSSGGPWVGPEDAEKNVVFADITVRGGEEFDGVLPRPADPHGFYRGLKVLAFPRPAAERIDPADFGAAVSLKNTTAADIAFAKPFPLSGLALRFAGGGRHVIAKVTVEVARGGGFERIVDAVEVYPMRYGFEDDRIFVPAVASGATAVRLSCVLTKGARLASVRPEACGRIAEERAKTFVIRSRIADLQNPIPPELAVDRGRILDVTPSLEAGDRFHWKAPADADEWTVVRFGYAANGTRCRPPTPAGDGLEVDKLSKTALGRYFRNGYIDRALATIGPVSRRGGVNSLIIDSFEVKSQNWTDGFERTFAVRRGYDLTPWLVAFTGRIVDSVAATDAFLSDFRQVVADLFSENYAAEFHRLCRARGLKLYLEGYGSAPCVDLRYARHCDFPMGEFWSGPVAKIGNCRFAASVAHVWGHQIVASESFTSGPEGRWDRAPFDFKAQGDRVYCAGVNRIVYHRWAHQPWTDPANYPGMTMGPHGSHFERTQTWWDDAAPGWLGYQARCQWMLSRGVIANDVLVVADERVPSCGFDLTRWHEYEGLAADLFGRGIQWDICDREALEASTVRDGRTIVPSGAEYLSVVRLPDAGRPQIAPDLACADERISRDLRWIHRRTADDEIYFVALPNDRQTAFEISFRQLGRTPELWDPETGSVRVPANWREQDGRTFVTLNFKPSGSAFVVFRRKPTANIPLGDFETANASLEIAGPWTVRFLDGRGAPAEATFESLHPWNEHRDEGIRHYSGRAVYAKLTDLPEKWTGARVTLDLGEVRNVAVVTANGRTYPCLWRPPFRLDLTDALKPGERTLSLAIRVTNLWPNRLIGDEELPCDAVYSDKPGEGKDGIVEIPERVWKNEPSPCGRHTFTTWRLWSRDDPLLKSGLIGPVRLEFTDRKEP